MSGWNPTSGFDGGAPPPTSAAGQAQAFAGGYDPYAAYAGDPMTYPGGGYSAAPPPPYDYGYSQGYGMPGAPGSTGPMHTMAGNGYQHGVPQFNFPGQDRPMQPHPVVNQECPALNLQNSTGGAGCEPGYNYFFPAEHTKIHVVKTRTAPWQLPVGFDAVYGAYHVPSNVTLGDLMKGFGATNPTPKKNKITELYSGGNRWYKGVTFCADDEDTMKKTLKDLGWDHSRTGRAHIGEKPVVWLWVTKD